MLIYATREFGEVLIIVWRSMLASESGEIDRARFRLNLGVTRGLENRDTAGKRDFVRQDQWAAPFLQAGWKS